MILVRIFNAFSNYVWDIFRMCCWCVLFLVVCALLLAIASVILPFGCALAAKRVVFGN